MSFFHPQVALLQLFWEHSYWLGHRACVVVFLLWETRCYSVADVNPGVVRGSRAEFPRSLFYPIRAFYDGAANLCLHTDFLQLLQHSKAKPEFGFLRVVIISWGSENPSRNLMFWQLNKASEKTNSLTSGTKIFQRSPRQIQQRTSPPAPHNYYCTALPCPQLSQTGTSASRC